MRIFNTATDVVDGSMENLWVYNGLDNCMTLEVLHAIKPQLDEVTAKTYHLSLALQSVCFEMKLRGVRIDLEARDQLIRAAKADIRKLEKQLNRIIKDGLGLEEVRWSSHHQLKVLFYKVMGLKPITGRNSAGVWAPTVNRHALEKLNQHFDAQPLVSHILKLRDIDKQAQALKTSVDPDGRMRTSYNIGGTTTGRLSSSYSDTGTGGNLQNRDPRVRSIFIADPGMKLAYIDLEQAESRAVGAILWNLFGDGTYLDACESGDLHSKVAAMCWPENGDISQVFNRQLSYRDTAKRLGHGTVYGGLPITMSRETKIERVIVEEFQRRFFEAFPGIRRWHQWVADKLLADGWMVSLMGRRRHFFGRRDDHQTVKEAIAFDPQGSVGDILNRGMIQVWRANECQLLMQVHDAILVQYPESDEDRLLPSIIKTLTLSVPLENGRALTIPSEAKVGWNWGLQEIDKAGNVTGNPDGLRKWKGHDDRRRHKKPPSADVLDRLVC